MKRRHLAAVLSTVISAALVSAAPTVPSASAAVGDVHLVCDINVTLVFNPHINTTVDLTNIHGTGKLGTQASLGWPQLQNGPAGSCTSPDGTATGITYGNGTGQATGNNSCTQAEANGSGRINWSDDTHTTFSWTFLVGAGAGFEGTITGGTRFTSNDKFIVEPTGFDQDPFLGACFTADQENEGVRKDFIGGSITFLQAS